MSTTDPRLLTWLGSPWSRECDICGVVTTDPERTARHKAWHALVDVLIAERNDTAVVRDADDGAGKGSTAARTGARSDAQPAEAPGEGRGEIGPQKGVQSLGDEMRAEASEIRGLANGRPYVTGVRPDDLTQSADALTSLAARADVLEDERDRLAADVAIMRDAGMKGIVAERKRTKKAEAERDEARADARIWRKHVDDLAPRAEKAEAAVERVRAVVDARTSLCDTPRDPCPCHDGVDVADVLAALDGVDAGGEGK